MAQLFRLSGIGFATPAAGRIVKASTMNAVDEALEVVEAARRKAAEIVAESEAVYERRKAEGYSDGLEAAARDTLEQLLVEGATLDRTLKSMEGRLAALVADCVRTLVGETDTIVLAEALVRAALQRMRREQRAQLFVPPELVDPLRERVGAILSTFPEVELLDVVADPALTGSSIWLQSGLGRVRCDLPDALADLEAALRHALAEELDPDAAPLSTGERLSAAIEVNPAREEPA